MTQAWWNFRQLPNILTLHYADMKRDLSGCVASVAEFLEIDMTPERLAQVVEAASFENMKQRGGDYVPNNGVTWKGGSTLSCTRVRTAGGETFFQRRS